MKKAHFLWIVLLALTITGCKSEPTKTPVVCPRCGGESHPAACGVMEHYACDGLDHTTCEKVEEPEEEMPSGQPSAGNSSAQSGSSGQTSGVTTEVLCYYCNASLRQGQHGVAKCGINNHYVCKGDHSPASCGAKHHFVCDGRTHGANCKKDSTPESGETVKKCDVCKQPLTQGEHKAASCGVPRHYTCQGVHDLAVCGVHYQCDGKEHAKAPCGVAGHCVLAGKHPRANCRVLNHYACDGKEHTACATDGLIPVTVAVGGMGEEAWSLSINETVLNQSSTTDRSDATYKEIDFYAAKGTVITVKILSGNIKIGNVLPYELSAEKELTFTVEKEAAIRISVDALGLIT